MRLNQASDFALRMLMLLAKENQAMTLEDISEKLGLVKSHLMKISAKLRQAGIIEAQRGRLGGVSLARDASEISVGGVVRSIENDFAIVECMKPGSCQCSFLPNCKLKNSIFQAKEAFLSVLDAQMLDELVA